jgi:hypothetical protein
MRKEDSSSGEGKMRLIGMLDSPFVRRVAMSLKLMGIDFALEPISLFRELNSTRSIRSSKRQRWSQTTMWC